MGSGSNCDFVDEEESRTPLLAHLSERPEQGERVRMHFWALWVPLYAHDPPTICAFHRFDETVRRTRGRSEGWRETLFCHPLMVARVHAKRAALPVNTREVARAIDGHVMPVGCTVFLPAVCVALDVLQQPTAQCHVKQFVTTAYAEDRQVAL